MFRKTTFILSVALLGIRPVMALTFDEIKFLPFMGGSLMFNQAKPTESHLATGKNYAFRFSDLYTKRVAVADLTGLNAAEKQDLLNSGLTAVDMFDEDEDKINYGEIVVSSITGTVIQFQYTLFNAGGQKMYTKSAALGLGQSLDMDSDGKPDMEYTATISSIRSNVAGIAYLRCLSSQTGLYTSMFSYAPELQAGLTEFDLIGFNPNGNAIIRDRNTAFKSSTSGTVSTLAKASASSFDASKFKSGDYILDLTTSTYVPILNQGGVLAKSAANAQTIESVLPLVSLEQRAPFDLSVQRTTAKNPDNVYLAHDAGQYAVNRDGYFNSMTQEGRARFGPYGLGDWRYSIGNGGVKVGIKDPKLTLAIGASIKILWSKAGVKANVSAGLLFEGDIAGSVFDGATTPNFSSFTKVTDTLKGKPTTFYKSSLKEQAISIPQSIISETLVFSLMGIPVTWGLNQSMKFDINLVFNKRGQTGAKFYWYNMLVINARATVLDGSGIGFGSTNSKLEFLPYYQIDNEARLSLKISPKYTLEPYVRIGPIVKATPAFYVGFDNDWTVSYTSTDLWFKTYLDFIYGLNVDVHIGKSFTLGAYGFSKEFNLDKTFTVPVYNESFRIFEIGISKKGIAGALFDNLVTANDDKIFVQQKKIWAPLGLTGPSTMFLNFPASYSLNNLLQPNFYSETVIYAGDINNNFKQSYNIWFSSGWNQHKMDYLVKQPTNMTLKFPIKGNYVIFGRSCFTPDLTEACETTNKEIKVTNFPIVPTILAPLLLN